MTGAWDELDAGSIKLTTVGLRATALIAMPLGDGLVVVVLVAVFLMGILSLVVFVFVFIAVFLVTFSLAPLTAVAFFDFGS